MKTKVDLEAHVNVGDIVERLKKIYDVRTDLELCSRLKVPQSTLSNWRTRRNAVPFELLTKIAVDNKVSLDSLILGHTSVEHAWDLLSPPGIDPDRFPFAVAVNKEHFRGDPGQYLAIIVRDVFMEPTISIGDMVIARSLEGDETSPRDPSEDYITPGLYVTREEGRMYVRRLQPLGRGRIRVIPDNERLLSYDLGIDEISIVGPVVWTLRKEHEPAPVPELTRRMGP